MAIDPVTGAAVTYGLGWLWDKISGGNDPQVSYQSSPEQTEMLKAIQPLVERMAAFGTGTGGVPYNIPDPQSMMPTKGFMDRLDPNVRAGLFEPFEQGLDILEGRMAGRGQLGNVRAGMSGAAADVFGRFSQQFLPQVAQSAFQTMQPALQTGYSALLEREKSPYSSLLGMAPGLMPTGFVQPQQSNPLSTFSNFYMMNSLLGSGT